ncbi:MAG: PEP-CTERM sorting domain-containing protein [Gammaproteobacteria bacterium]|nr:PEP-CTERM sorting domain-containing protein [Gammaproteobacteria bacterium]
MTINIHSECSLNQLVIEFPLNSAAKCENWHRYCLFNNIVCAAFAVAQSLGTKKKWIKKVKIMKISVMRHKFSTVVLLAITMAFGTVNASAVPIDGAIGFGGLFNPTGGAGVDLSDATGLTFGFSFVSAASGDLAAAVGENVFFSDFDFDPASTPVTPLWDIPTLGYSFDLLDVNVTGQTAAALNLEGTGIMMAAGFDDTPGEWVFSGDSVGGVFFTFSSISTTTPVAEPGTALLLGLGLLGMGIVRRRRNG